MVRQRWEETCPSPPLLSAGWRGLWRLPDLHFPTFLLAEPGGGGSVSTSDNATAHPPAEGEVGASAGSRSATLLSLTLLRCL